MKKTYIWQWQTIIGQQKPKSLRMPFKTYSAFIFFWPPLNLTKSQALYNLNWPPLKFSKYKNL